MNNGFATPVDTGAIYKACAVTGCPTVSYPTGIYPTTPGTGYNSTIVFDQVMVQEQQKECNMSVGCQEACVMVEDESLEQESRKHLKSRAHDVRRVAIDAAEEKFNINSLTPKTWGEFRKFIRDGFTSVKDAYKTKGEDDGTGHVRYDWPYAIEFRDPSKPKDQAGFDTAKASIERDYENVIDAIMTLEPREAREELKTFQAKY